jgi:hypothetical protein
VVFRLERPQDDWSRNCLYDLLRVDGTTQCPSSTDVLVYEPGDVDSWVTGGPGFLQTEVTVTYESELYASPIVFFDDPMPTAICEASCTKAVECTPGEADPVDVCTADCLDGLALTGDPIEDACRPLYVAFEDCLTTLTCSDVVAVLDGTAGTDVTCVRVEVAIDNCEAEVLGDASAWRRWHSVLERHRRR